MSEIDDYIRANRGRYTDQAIHHQLVAAGHDPEVVDGAFRSAAPATPATPGPPYWRSVFGLNGAVLVAVTVILLIQGNSFAWAAFVVLGVALVISTGVAGGIGRALLPRTGLVVALLVPLIAALLLGGWCLAGMQGSVI